MSWGKLLKIAIFGFIFSSNVRAAPPEVIIDPSTNGTEKPASITVKSDHLYMRNIAGNEDLDLYVKMFADPVAMGKYMQGVPRPMSEILGRHQKYLSWWNSGNPFTSYLVYLNEETSRAFLEEQEGLLPAFSDHLNAFPGTPPVENELRALPLLLASLRKELDTSRRIFIGHVLLEEGEDRKLKTDAEISYILRPAFWGRGLGTEAVKNAVALAQSFRQRNMVLNSHIIDTIIATALSSNPGSCRVLEKNGFTIHSVEEKFGAIRRLYTREL